MAIYQPKPMCPKCGQYHPEDLVCVRDYRWSTAATGLRVAEPEPGPGLAPPDEIREAVTKDTQAERERCLALLWEHRDLFPHNGAALQMMGLINGRM